MSLQKEKETYETYRKDAKDENLVLKGKIEEMEYYYKEH